MKEFIGNRSKYVYHRVVEKLVEIQQLARDENWDGRDIFAGFGMVFKLLCVHNDISPQYALSIIKNIELEPAQSGDTSLIIRPGGRPLGKDEK